MRVYGRVQEDPDVTEQNPGSSPRESRKSKVKRAVASACGVINNRPPNPDHATAVSPARTPSPHQTPPTPELASPHSQPSKRSGIAQAGCPEPNDTPAWTETPRTNSLQ